MRFIKRRVNLSLKVENWRSEVSKGKKMDWSRIIFYNHFLITVTIIYTLQNLEVAVKSIFHTLANRTSTFPSRALLHHFHPQSSMRGHIYRGHSDEFRGEWVFNETLGERVSFLLELTEKILGWGWCQPYGHHKNKSNIEDTMARDEERS